MAVGYLGGGSKWNLAHGTVTPIVTGNGTIAGGDANTWLIAFVAHDSGATITTVTLDAAGTPQALSFIGTVSNPAATQVGELWGKQSPTAVSGKTIEVAFSGAGEVMAGASYFTGVTGTLTFSSTNGTSNAPSLAVTTAAGDATLTFVFDNKAATLSNPGTGAQTTIELQSVNIDGGAGYALSLASSDNHVWAYSGSCSWGVAGVRLSVGGAAETITVDKWFAKQADVIRRLRGVVSSGTIGIKT